MVSVWAVLTFILQSASCHAAGDGSCSLADRLPALRQAEGRPPLQISRAGKRIEIRTDRLTLKSAGSDWGVYDASGKYVGAFLVSKAKEGAVEFTIGLDVKGQGYGTEAWSHLLRYYFEEVGVPRVVSHVQDTNAVSLRMHQKLGFRQIGHDRDGGTFELRAEDFGIRPR